LSSKHRVTAKTNHSGLHSGAAVDAVIGPLVEVERCVLFPAALFGCRTTDYRPSNVFGRDPLITFAIPTRGPEALRNPLTVESIPGFILLMVQLRASETLRSGTLAKKVGLSPDTIRHYERTGVLPPASRTLSGYRLYPASAVERVRVIQNALQIGFTLAELAEVLRARDAGGAPCLRVFQIAQDKLKKVSADIRALKQTEHYLKEVLKDWEKRMRRAGPKQRSSLLYSLNQAPVSSAVSKPLRRRNGI
jgi:DNA-binding transcriptional MerR regulator